jgi:hypothetical protein
VAVWRSAWDDGRVIATRTHGPADQAGIELKAEILEINGQLVDDAVDATVPWSGPFSADHARRLQQLRYVLRFPLDTEVEVTYKNPGEAEPVTPRQAMSVQLSFSSLNVVNLTGLSCCGGQRADSGYGYIDYSQRYYLLTLPLCSNINTNKRRRGSSWIWQNGGGCQTSASDGGFSDEETYAGHPLTVKTGLPLSSTLLRRRPFSWVDEQDLYHGILPR